MKTTTETISTDPWKFGATVTCETSNGTLTHTYIGDEDESRAKVKKIAIQQMEVKLHKLFGSRNGN